MFAYTLVLSESAAATLVTASRREQRMLAAALHELKAAPFRLGDLRERDALGRINEVRIAGDWHLIYWLDHAMREVRLVRLERVGK